MLTKVDIPCAFQKYKYTLKGTKSWNLMSSPCHEEKNQQLYFWLLIFLMCFDCSFKAQASSHLVICDAPE